MSDYPVGTYHSQTFGTTISNFAGNTGQPGGGPVRVFNVFLDAGTTAGSALTFYNGLASSPTSTAYLTVYAVPGAVKTATYFDSHAGVLFPNGCFITTSAALLYGTVSYRNEVL